MFSQLELWLAATIRQQLADMGEAAVMEDPQHAARYVHYNYIEGYTLML